MSQRKITATINGVAASGTGVADQYCRTNRAEIVKVKVTANLAGGTYDIEIFKRDTKLAADLAYKAAGISATTFFDPREDQSGVSVEKNEGPVGIYEDLDSTEELHIKVTNNDSQVKNFTVEVTIVDLRPLEKGEAQGTKGTSNLTFTTPDDISASPAPRPYVAGTLKVYFNGARVPEKNTSGQSYITETNPATGTFAFTDDPGWRKDTLGAGVNIATDDDIWVDFEKA